MTSAAPHAEPAVFVAEQARRFVELVFGEEPQGLIEVRTLADNTSAEQTFARSIDEAITAIGRAAARRRNAYVGVATRRASVSGKKENLAALRALWVDRDFADESDRDAHARTLAGFPLRPSLRVWTGGGEHDSGS